MTNRYEINYAGRKIAIAYLSPHPQFHDHIIVSVTPLIRKGKWEDNTLEITFESALYDIFPASKPESEAVNEVLAQAGIELDKVDIHHAW